MKKASKIVVGLIGALHVYILVMEMFLWTTDSVRKTFATTLEFAEQTTVLAANQGLYNGFLAAGLFWGLVYKDERVARHIQTFFLICVAVAGVYGAATAKPSILFVQTVPASVGLVLVAMAGRMKTPPFS